MAVFLRENGVLTMGNKTPVTILQETLQRRGINPHYELVYNGVGTLDPVFKFRVSAAGLTAIGDGKSKKEAKHDAAAALLKRMQVNKAVTENSEVEATEEMDIASPYSGALKQNFVGMLDETCVTNKTPLPVYIPVGEEGPPHARIFTMQCRLASCTEIAVARTKKQAKHMVAQQMINRVADILGDKFIPIVDKSMEPDDSEEVKNLKAIESGSFQHDLAIEVADLHNVFYHRTEEFLVSQKFLDLGLKPEEFYEQLPNPKEFLDELLRGLDGTCKIVPVSIAAVKQAIQEIEKDCQMFWWGEVEDISDEGEVDWGKEDEFCLEKYELEEFSLEDSEDESEVKDTASSSEPSQLNGPSNHKNQVDTELPKEESVLDSCEKNLKELDLKDERLNNLVSEEKTNCKTEDGKEIKPVWVFLSVECPQGSWAFKGFGESLEHAVGQAAVVALKFLRAMSISSSSNKAVENNP